MATIACLAFAFAWVFWHAFEDRWDDRIFSVPSPGIAANLGVTEAQHLVLHETALVILDTRSVSEFSGPRLENAIHLPASAPDLRERLEALDRNRPYLVYCAGGYRSRKVCEVMNELEFREFYNLHRGILSWRLAGKPIEDGEVGE